MAPGPLHRQMRGCPARLQLLLISMMNMGRQLAQQ